MAPEEKPYQRINTLHKHQCARPGIRRVRRRDCADGIGVPAAIFRIRHQGAFRSGGSFRHVRRVNESRFYGAIRASRRVFIPHSSLRKWQQHKKRPETLGFPAESNREASRLGDAGPINMRMGPWVRAIGPKLKNSVRRIKLMPCRWRGLYGKRAGTTNAISENQPCKNCIARKNPIYSNRLQGFFDSFGVDTVDQKVAKHLDPHGIAQLFRINEVGIQSG